MVLRTARRGKNAGGQFWGCSNYPKCKGLIAASIADNLGTDPGPELASDQAVDQGQGEPVYWRDALTRKGYFSEFISIGATPGFASGIKALQEPIVRKVASQALILSKHHPTKEVPDHQKAVASIIQKLLARGALPLSTLRVEEAIIRTSELSGQTVSLDEHNLEIGWEWSAKPPLGLTRDISEAFTFRSEISEQDLDSLTDDCLSDVLDGDNERYFFEKWLKQTIGINALHWVSPQADLDLILASAGIEQSGQRKIDFLFCHPIGGTFAVELDGEDHASKVRSDTARDNDLARAGIKTFRISNEELEIGEGPNLNQLEQALRTSGAAQQYRIPQGMPRAIQAASAAARFQFILARALSAGRLSLSAEKWNIGIRSDFIELELFQAAADDFADMINSLSVLYAKELNSLTIRCQNFGQSSNPNDISVANLLLESPLTVGLRDLVEDYVICGAFAPVDFVTDTQKVSSRTQLNCEDAEKANAALLVFLQNLYRKRAFRELQAEAIINALKGQDTVTLLPTGAGKSIIYQLAGLLQSGLTLVIDPIVALIEDQILGLARVGIDKAGAPPSGLDKAEARRRWLRAVERGDFHFILMSPERLQMAETREALRALAEVTHINMAVIDEAHCVSEWGHNFRFSYLNLADNLRNYCRTLDGQSPTLLALTGTASRSILRELLTELKIGKDNSDALIRPLNFDRNELKFHITKVNGGGDSSAILRGILNGLPAKFNVPPGEFFQPAGSATNSGIVFTPFVNGRSHGLFAVKSAIQSAVKVPVTTYSGSAPKGIDPRAWETDKRHNAQSFKDNEAPILVATKAFGMGIDKPNIRWTVHMGVPSSMEAFYQEAGRAGRDKNLAYCNLIFSEVDPDATDKALVAHGTLDDLRHAAANFKNNNDDISRALFFHLNAYSGVDEEVEEAAKVLQTIGDLKERKNVEIPFNKNTKSSIERAILRLVKTGIVDDLEVNFGSGFFTLRTPAFEFQKARQKFEQYISDAQPARLKAIALQLDQIETVDVGKQPIELCRLMINFTYDVIERSRRRMLYEAILLGRNYSTDLEIRQYLMNYLQEGLGAEQIAALAEQKDVDFDAWISLFEKVSTPLDAGEIRGIIIRLLETFPDHPGMLAARGISESLVGKPDESLIRDSILAALDTGRNRYSCSVDQLVELLANLVDLANSKSSHLRLPILDAIKKSQAIDDSYKSIIWDRIKSKSITWDEKSRLYISGMIAHNLISKTIPITQALISHYSELQQELN